MGWLAPIPPPNTPPPLKRRLRPCGIQLLYRRLPLSKPKPLPKFGGSK